MEFNPSSMSRVMVRATNWLGDAVMSLPAIRAIRGSISARPSRGGGQTLGGRSVCAGNIHRPRDSLYAPRPSARNARSPRACGSERFDGAILLQNAFDAALIAWMAGIPERIGYRRDGRGLLLTRAIPVPEPGDIPRHERFYYLELLRRAGMLERFPDTPAIRLDGAERRANAALQRLARDGDSYSRRSASAPERLMAMPNAGCRRRFAETAARLAGTHQAAALVFGSAAERPLCEIVTASIAGGRSGGAESCRRNLAERVHRTGGGLPRLSDQRFRRHARGFGARRADGGRFRRDRRHHHRPYGPAGARDSRARRVQPVPAARVSHRPSLHDARQRQPRRGSGAVSYGRNPRRHGYQKQDSERGRVAAELNLRRGQRIFRPAAGVARARVEGIRAGAGALAVVVLPLDGELLPQSARAELVAALRVVDYVVIGDNGDLDRLFAELKPAQIVRLEDDDFRRRGQLMEHVRSR